MELMGSLPGGEGFEAGEVETERFEVQLGGDFGGGGGEAEAGAHEAGGEATKRGFVRRFAVGGSRFGGRV